MANLRKLKETFPIYGDYGFMDSVNVSTGLVADRVLLLDQGMIMAAIANALADDAMRRALIDGPSERILRPLIAPEEFTAGPDSAGPALRRRGRVRLEIASVNRRFPRGGEGTRSVAAALPAAETGPVSPAQRAGGAPRRAEPGDAILFRDDFEIGFQSPDRAVADVDFERARLDDEAHTVVVEPQAFGRERKPDGPRLVRLERQPFEAPELPDRTCHAGRQVTDVERDHFITRPISGVPHVDTHNHSDRGSSSECD